MKYKLPDSTIPNAQTAKLSQLTVHFWMQFWIHHNGIQRSKRKNCKSSDKNRRLHFVGHYVSVIKRDYVLEEKQFLIIYRLYHPVAAILSRTQWSDQRYPPVCHVVKDILVCPLVYTVPSCVVRACFRFLFAWKMSENSNPRCFLDISIDGERGKWLNFLSLQIFHSGTTCFLELCFI